MYRVQYVQMYASDIVNAYIVIMPSIVKGIAKVKGLEKWDCGGTGIT